MADNDAASSITGLDAGDDVATVGKIDVTRDGTPSSMGSTPEHDGDMETTQEPTAQPQKRKGGRKPIYATSEERKQRNRQAQAAFRERRTEYIKQLEATIKQNEETLGTLQQSHRSAADECLMLRYKNSLLERILLEKGIDVQTELQMKSGSPAFPPGFMQQLTGMSQMQSSQPPLQRAAIQRQHARRSGQALTPKLAPGHSHGDLGFNSTSPQAGPTPSSHVSSPSNLSTRSPIAMQTGGMTPPASGIHAQSQGQHTSHFPRSQQSSLNPVMYQPPQQGSHLQRAQRPGQFQAGGHGLPKPPNNSQSNGPHPPGSSGSGANGTAGSVTSASAYYPSPFQKHIDQLEQEYDTTNGSHSMLDQHDTDPDHASDPDNLDAHHNLHGNYPSQQYDQTHPPAGQGFGYQQGGQSSHMPPPGQQQMTPNYEQQQQQHLAQGQQQQGNESESGAYASIPHMIDPNDPLLDADPFGLSASMHYPTSYSFDQGGGGR